VLRVASICLAATRCQWIAASIIFFIFNIYVSIVMKTKSVHLCLVLATLMLTSCMGSETSMKNKEELELQFTKIPQEEEEKAGTSQQKKRRKQNTVTKNRNK